MTEAVNIIVLLLIAFVGLYVVGELVKVVWSSLKEYLGLTNENPYF